MKTDKLVKLSSVIAAMKAEPLTNRAETDLAGCYISDLLSDVLAHANPGVLWITVQTHRNVISCALAKDISAVLFTCGRKPDPGVVAEADAENIVLLSTKQTAYEVAGKLWEAGLR
jgi:predicted transcriptional regulator